MHKAREHNNCVSTLSSQTFKYNLNYAGQKASLNKQCKYYGNIVASVVHINF
jgi:hypothetical protein